MPLSVLEITERLVRVTDNNGTVRDMAVAAEAISLLEKISVTKEDLEKTRLGKYVNFVRKAAAAENNPLARRARSLVKTWQQMITPQRQPLPQQRLRPETPNSVGSSPSPPNPYTPPTPSQVFTPQAPRSATPTSASASKRSKKHKEVSKSSKANKKKLKSPEPANGAPDGINSQSSEVKKSPESQNLMSVGTNGLKLTFKKTPQTESNDDEEVDVVVSDGSQQWRRDMLERTDESKRASTPTQKDGRKKHKKKKQHKSPHKTVTSPAQALHTTPSREPLPSQEDLYNNNNKQPKMHVSQSTPSFTVLKQSITKVKSPDKSLKNHLVSTPKSCNDLQKLASESTSANLKRKRENSQVNDVSPDSPPASRGDKPRGTKERRLTFDPVTGQLQQRPSTKKPDQNYAKPTKKSPDKVQIFKQESKSAKMPNKSNFSPGQKMAAEKLKYEPKRSTLPQRTVADHTNKVEKVAPDKLPTGLVPSISITNPPSSPAEICSGKCGTSFHETRRQFRKRKTRRKNTIMDLPSLFPLSNLVTMTSSPMTTSSPTTSSIGLTAPDTVTSDSDEASDPENTFCSTLGVHVKPQVRGGVKHSSACEQPGVNGCRGNNGQWYDWLDTFCIQNHNKETTEPLPNEDEIMPLHILPYVELD